MRLAMSSASLTAAFAATQGFFRISSNSVVASIVDRAHESEAHQSDAKRFLDVECSFVNSFQFEESEVDTGILGCSDPEYICVEDEFSSLGGRCSPRAMAHRELQAHVPTTSCAVKCTGVNACGGGTDVSKIGANSCCGYKACFGIKATTIDTNSCLGYKACINADVATIGKGSCTGDKIKGRDGFYGYSCAHMFGKIGDGSCYEYGACYQRPIDEIYFKVGNNSCRGQGACGYLNADDGVGDNSCRAYYACYYMYQYGSVANGSCNAKKACFYNHEAIGDNRCNIAYQCYKNYDVLDSYTVLPSKKPSPATTKAPNNAPMMPTTSKPASDAKASKGTKGTKTGGSKTGKRQL